MEKPYKKMNIGCGEDIMPNYINIDYYNFKGVDVVHDLNSKEELPFPDAFFEEVIGYDIFEHVNVSIAIDKIKKKMSPGAILKIKVPHFSYFRAWEDPTHLRGFAFNSFDFFLKNGRKNFSTESRFCKIQSKKISFLKRWYFPWNYLLEFVINLDYRIVYIYESSGLVNLFPAENLHVELVVCQS
jgi:hypothetical protein